MSAAASSTITRSTINRRIEAPAANAPALNPAPRPDETELRIKALLAENAEYERRAALYRSTSEEFQALSMRKPQTTAQSYRTLGLLLGAFPPAAYFTHFGGYGLGSWNYNGNFAFFFLLFFMNMVCIVVGLNMGKVVGKQMEKFERASWSKMILFSLLLALSWAAVTGFAGGAIVFIMGGFFGLVFALPVALAAFPAFAVIHRLMERGHLIERKHLLPVAYGISLAISAFILGYH